MTQQILEPATKVEAEMAAAATTCIMAALDHSRAEKIRLRIELATHEKIITLYLGSKCNQWLSTKPSAGNRSLLERQKFGVETCVF